MMSTKKRIIQFSPPDISDLEIENVVDTLRSGWITTGTKTKKLEKKLAEYLTTSKVVCLNSATAGLELVLRILGVGPGDEVIVPAMTYTATCSIIEHVGAKPVIVDIQKESFEMDYEQVKNLINENTKVIIPVDLAGIPCNYDLLYKIIDEKKSIFKAKSEYQSLFGRIVLLSDSAHSFGATYKGRKVGSVADFTVFSFHAVKNFTTGEGGAVTWREHKKIDDEKLYTNFQIFSLHGQTKDALSKTKLGSWEYDISLPGYKCNMTDIMAAIGLGQFERYPELLNRRTEIVSLYNKLFENTNIIPLNHFSDSFTSSKHLYIIHISGITMDLRNEIINQMAENGIACNVHYKPLPLLTAYANLGFNIEDYPNAFSYYKNTITLPLHTKLSDEDVIYIANTLKNILKEK